MKKIDVGHNRFAGVDDEDYDKLMQFTWHSDLRGNTYYAVTNVKVNGKYTTMHCAITLTEMD